MSSRSGGGGRGGAPSALLPARATERRSFLAASAALLAALAGAACTAAPAPAFGSGLARVPASSSARDLEREMAARLNRDRKEHGLPPLRFDERLSEIARHHSADMRDHHFFEHASPQTGNVDNRLDAAGYAFVTARENLSEAPDVERGQEGLLDSPPHYANIMSSDVSHVGIGIVDGGVVDSRNITITQVFARPAEDVPPEQAERRALQRLDRGRAAHGKAPVQRDAQLMQLAEKHLADIAAPGGTDSVDRASQAILHALSGREGRVLITAQLVPGPDQVALAETLFETPRCAVGLAMRRATGEHGRPALLLLMIILDGGGQG